MIIKTDKDYLEDFKVDLKTHRISREIFILSSLKECNGDL